MTIDYRDAAEFCEVLVSYGDWRIPAVAVWAHPWRDKAVVVEELADGSIRKIHTQRSRCERLDAQQFSDAFDEDPVEEGWGCDA